MARTEVLEVAIAAPARRPRVARHGAERVFRHSRWPTTTRLSSGSTRRVVAAAGREITTGIVDGTNLLVMDMDLCIRCGNCSLACHKVHGQSRLLRRGIHIERPVKPASTSIQHVLVAVGLHALPGPGVSDRMPDGRDRAFPDGQIDIDPKTCIGCGDCATQCPYNAISMVPRKAAVPLAADVAAQSSKAG